MDLLEAIKFMQYAHFGQLDKGGLEYWYHPLRVMIRLGPKASFEEQCAALMHDVLEDTKVTKEEMLEAGVPKHSVMIVDKFLTRRPEVTYNNYVQNIVDHGDRSACRSKFADLADNMSPSRSDSLPEHMRGIKHRYVKSRTSFLEKYPSGVFDDILEGDLPAGMLEEYLLKL